MKITKEEVDTVYVNADRIKIILEDGKIIIVEAKGEWGASAWLNVKEC